MDEQTTNTFKEAWLASFDKVLIEGVIKQNLHPSTAFNMLAIVTQSDTATEVLVAMPPHDLSRDEAVDLVLSETAGDFVLERVTAHLVFCDATGMTIKAYGWIPDDAEMPVGFAVPDYIPNEW